MRGDDEGFGVGVSLGLRGEDGVLENESRVIREFFYFFGEKRLRLGLLMEV